MWQGGAGSVLLLGKNAYDFHTFIAVPAFAAELEIYSFFSELFAVFIFGTPEQRCKQLSYASAVFGFDSSFATFFSTFRAFHSLFSVH